jgi:hypothetical protein
VPRKNKDLHEQFIALLAALLYVQQCSEHCTVSTAVLLFLTGMELGQSGLMVRTLYIYVYMC